MNTWFGAAAVATAAMLAGTASGQSLTIGVAFEAVSMDPCWDNGSHTQQIGNNVFGPFIQQDHVQRPTPALATSWKPVDDQTWEFKVREGVKFTDGSPLTADDVIFSFNHYGYKGVERCWTSGPGRYIRTSKKEIKKIDDHTIHVLTDAPHPLTVMDMSTFNVLSKKQAEGVGQPDDYNNGKAMIGAGPYKFVEWVPADRLVMVANPDWWGGKPKWEKVVWKPLKSDPSRLAALLAGEVDIIDKIPPADIARIRKTPNITVSEGPSSRIIHFQVDSGSDVSPLVKTNDGEPFFPNPLRKWEVRKALSMAIDRKGIAERVMEGLSIPASQVLPDGFLGVSPNLKLEAYDPEGAKALLKKVGLGDGFEITVSCPNDRYINDEKICEAVAQFWSQIDIKTNVETYPKAIFFTRGRTGAYSMSMMGWGSDSGDPSSPLSQTLHSYQPDRGYGAVNQGRYANRRFDDVLEKALVTIDADERAKLYQEATEIVMNDVGMIPIHYQVNTWAMRKGLSYQARTDERILIEQILRTN